MKCFLLTTDSPGSNFLSLLAAEPCVLYALHDGILLLPKIHSSEVRRFGCAYAVQRRNLPMDPEIIYGGLGILADLLRQAEMILPFPGTQKGAALRFRILSNPKISDRPAEAFRVAAGLQSLGIPIQVELAPSARDGLQTPSHEWVDGELLEASRKLLEAAMTEKEAEPLISVLDW